MKRAPAKSFLITLVGLAGLIAACLAARANEARPSPEEADEVFDRMAGAVDGLRDYRCEWTHLSITGERPINGRRISRGKFLRTPELYWKEIVKMEADYPDPTESGTQLIYDSGPHELRVLLPGVKRLLGVVHVFGEDKKTVWLNGESLENESLWNLVESWRQKRERGETALRREEWNGKVHDVIELSFRPEPSPRRDKKVGRIEIWVDPQSSLPLRHRGFVSGTQEPVLDYLISRMEPNRGLRARDVDFHGLSLWSFPASFVANDKGLDELEAVSLVQAEKGQPPCFSDMRSNFEKVLQPVGDYTADLRIEQSIGRVKFAGRVKASIIREPYFFLFEFDDDFRSNHISMATAGSRVCYRRKEHSYAAVGAGAMRLVGVQLMHVDDPRSDFAFGDSLYHLSLYSLLDLMKWYEQNGQVSADLVTHRGKTCPRAKMKRVGEPERGCIQDVSVVLDPDAWMPRRVLYHGYGGPDDYALIEYERVETGKGLVEENLRF